MGFKSKLKNLPVGTLDALDLVGVGILDGGQIHIDLLLLVVQGPEVGHQGEAARLEHGSLHENHVASLEVFDGKDPLAANWRLLDLDELLPSTPSGFLDGRLNPGRLNVGSRIIQKELVRLSRQEPSAD